MLVVRRVHGFNRFNPSDAAKRDFPVSAEYKRTDLLQLSLDMPTAFVPKIKTFGGTNR